MELEHESDNKAFIVSTAISLVTFVLITIVSLSPSIQSALNLRNLTAYALDVAFSLIVFIIAYILLKHRGPQMPSKLNDRILYVFLFAGIITCTLVFLIQTLNESAAYSYDVFDNFAWHAHPLRFTAATLIIGAIVLFHSCRAKKGSETNASSTKERLRDVAYWAFATCFALGIATLSYTPNTSATFYAAFHNDAYFSSIVNVLFGTPFSDGFTSVYGHYAIFFAPAIKLASSIFSISYYSSYLLINSFLMFCSVLLFGYALWIISRKNDTAFLGLPALAFGFITSEAPYFQTYPERYFVLALGVAFIVFDWKMFSGEKKLATTLGYILCTLLIVWSTECGLFVLFGWMAYRLLRVKLSRPCLRKCLLSIVCVFGAAVLSLCLSLLIVNLYNISVGGGFNSLEQLLFPLMTEDFMVDLLEIPLTARAPLWILQVCIMIVALCYGMTNILHNSCDNRKAIIGGISILALASMTYGINRPTYGNLLLAYPLVIILACSLLSSIPKRSTVDAISLSGGFVAFTSSGLRTFLVIAFCMAVFTIPTKIEWQQPYWNKDVFDSSTKEIAKTIDQNTVALGLAATETYAAINRDPGVYIMDIPDVSKTSALLNHFGNTLGDLDDKSVLVSAWTLDRANEYAVDELSDFYDSHELLYDWAGTVTHLQYWTPTSSPTH